MYEIMGHHYDKLKEDIGIHEAFQNSDSEEET